MNEVKTRKTEASDDGMRLDRWFKKNYPAIGYGHLQKLFRTGQVRVDGKRAKAETRLTAGQEIRIPPLFETDAKAGERRGILPKDRDFIRSLVIYKDEDIIAINKPPGIAVQGGSKIGRHIDGLLDGLKDREDDERPRLVHRLDKETSGVLLLARHARSARVLGEAFKDRNIRKYYWAITVGVPSVYEGTIRRAIGKVATPEGERVMPDDEDGKMAITHYSVIERAGTSAAWVAFWPKTGRMHQIRVHAAMMKTPLLGDYKYGGDYSQIEGMDEHNLHLHARRVIMPHPFDREKMLDIVAPLPDEMKKTWKYFNFNPNDKSDPFEDVE